MSSVGDGHEQRSETLVDAALQILNTADPVDKARFGEAAAKRWLDGTITQAYPTSIDLLVPDRPARLSNVKLVSPRLMPKLGKAGSLRSRQAIIHSLVHTESWAIDLSWDIIARFGKMESMPHEFFTDFVKVAQDEGRHFTLLAARLRELGSFYGAFSAHDGLWDSAMATSKDLMVRLAVEHCVHEARGLDVLPTTISRFRNGGDDVTADLLETVVYPEEITHCAAGVKWFKYLCFRTSTRSSIPSSLRSQNTTASNEILEEQPADDADNGPIGSGGVTIGNTTTGGGDELDSVIRSFHAIIRVFFRGPLKPPFNERARKEAGFGPEWYEPLSTKEVGSK